MSLKSASRTQWEGDLFSGSGTTTMESGAAPPMQVTWKARSEQHGGVTSPEELIAAAHASCYSMALSNTLAQEGTPPGTLETQAAVTFVPGEGITAIELEVTGEIPGVSEDDFLAAADRQGDLPGVRSLRGQRPDQPGGQPGLNMSELGG